MIKLATMTSVCPDWDLDTIIKTMRQLGFSGLEPRVEWNHASGIELSLSASERSEVVRKMTDAGLEICCLATGVTMAVPDRVQRAAHIDQLHQYIDLAADLSSPLIRTFGGKRDHSVELSSVVDYVVEGYSEVLEHAAQCGVSVLLETHDDWICSAPVRAVAERIDHPSFGVIWDIMHPQRILEHPAATYGELKHHVRHVHAHDGRIVDGRMVVGALGEGTIDHFTPLQLLTRDGFDGYFSVEVIHSKGSAHDAGSVLDQYASKFREYMERVEKGAPIS